MTRLLEDGKTWDIATDDSGIDQHDMKKKKEKKPGTCTCFPCCLDNLANRIARGSCSHSPSYHNVVYEEGPTPVPFHAWVTQNALIG